MTLHRMPGMAAIIFWAATCCLLIAVLRLQQIGLKTFLLSMPRRLSSISINRTPGRADNLNPRISTTSTETASRSFGQVACFSFHHLLHLSNIKISSFDV